MDIETLKSHLSDMSQSQIIDVLLYEVKSAKNLKAKTDNAELAERNYSPRNEARSWANSEQYEKTKERIRAIVKHLT
jgi:hypothetical protein